MLRIVRAVAAGGSRHSVKVTSQPSVKGPAGEANRKALETLAPPFGVNGAVDGHFPYWGLIVTVRMIPRNKVWSPGPVPAAPSIGVG